VELAPSKTARYVAALRAGLERPSTPAGDPDAQRRLVDDVVLPPDRPLADHVATRTPFFDEAVLAAIERGVGQVVIVGAGYDDRALRFRTAGVRFFELDRPATQAEKARRLEAAGIDTSGLTLVPAKFGRDDPAAALARAGHEADRPTLFVCEGVLVYLEASEIHALLSALASRAAPGSTLSASLAIHGDGVDSRVAVAVANARRRDPAAEPWKTILPGAEHRELLRRAGWNVPDDARELVNATR
jgi:methyltransferase (TIGR00027 family)